VFHLAVYRESVAAGATNQSIDILAGSGDTVSNNQYFPVQNMDLLGVFGFGTNMSGIRISTPEIRTIAPLQIRPLVQGSTVPTNANFCDFWGNPPLMRMSENIDVQCSSADAGAQNYTVMLFLGVGNYRKASGPPRRVRATGTTALTANVWTPVVLTFDDNLPQGQYEIQGMEVITATGYAARVITAGNYWRPGVPVYSSLGNRLPAALLDKQYGSYGTFSTLALPQIEVLATAADAAQTVFFDLVKMS